MMTNKYSRRQFIQSSLYGLGAISALGLEGCKEKPHPSISRPNILLVVTDDQRWDAMGCAGNPIIHTPQMDALAARGTRFTNAFVTSPICCASRASIFTGLYERSHGHNFGTPPLSRPLIDLSYPTLLKQAGYRTGFVGKLGVFVDPGRHDFDRMFTSFEPLDRTPYLKKREDGERHLTEITADQTIRFLESNTDDRPFCLSVSFNAPHAEDLDPQQYFWPQSTDDFYRDLQIPPPGKIASEIFEASPEFLKNSLARKRWHWRFDTPEKYQQMVKGYYRMITGVDQALGRIMKTLDRLQLAENTIVIFLSDNGYFLGERGLAGKWLMYEPSIRIPLIIYDPRKQMPAGGQTLGKMALNVDIAPTVLDYAGITVPKSVQGLSLCHLLNPAATKWRNEIFCEHLYAHPEIPKSEMIRTTEWKYIRYPEFNNYEELYNHAKDPGEERNLARDQKYKSQLLSLRQQCDTNVKNLARS
ncbi:MAG: sulfatase [Proteobacteria bacterium]|nr:sulfatase [Pseudomonadota bacterium]MBU1715626.1 sulfatase [Pseudomonadota bacterium]